MATQQVILTTTLVAAGDLAQQCLVAYDGTLCKKGKPAIGVAEVDAKKGDATPVNCLGIIAAVAGAAVAVGDVVQSDDQGRVIKLETTGNPVPVGTATSAASEAGATLRVMWKP